MQVYIGLCSGRGTAPETFYGQNLPSGVLKINLQHGGRRSGGPMLAWPVRCVTYNLLLSTLNLYPHRPQVKLGTQQGVDADKLAAVFGPAIQRLEAFAFEHFPLAANEVCVRVHSMKKSFTRGKRAFHSRRNNQSRPGQSLGRSCDQRTRERASHRCGYQTLCSLQPRTPTHFEDGRRGQVCKRYLRTRSNDATNRGWREILR
jgi:hypothetical protein